MKVNIKLLKIGRYHEPSTFKPDDGKEIPVPENWDAIAILDDGDIVQVRLQGLNSAAKLSKDQSFTLEVAGCQRKGGMWLLKGIPTPNK